MYEFEPTGFVTATFKLLPLQIFTIPVCERVTVDGLGLTVTFAFVEYAVHDPFDISTV